MEKVTFPVRFRAAWKTRNSHGKRGKEHADVFCGDCLCQGWLFRALSEFFSFTFIGHKVLSSMIL